MGIVDEIRTRLDRIVRGEESPADRAATQLNLLRGELTVEDSPGIVSAGGDVSGVVVTGNNNHVSVYLPEPNYSAVRAKLFPRPPGVAPPLPSLLFLGRADDSLNIKKLLRSSAMSDERFVVVDGWPGVGKTSLAAAIGHDPDVLTDYPDGVLWAPLGKTPNLFAILASWGHALGKGDLLRLPTLDDVVGVLAGAFEQRRFLMIVDDAWDVAHLSPFLKLRRRSSALLVTTRLPAVAEAFTTADPRRYRLPVLREDDAFRLLRVLAPDVVECQPKECVELVRDLERLPLALHVAGRLLRAESRLGWGVAELLDSIRSGAAIIAAKAPDDLVRAGVLPTVAALLNKSTDFLDERTRGHFACLGVFAPKPATFDLEAMSAVWEEASPQPFVRTLVSHGLLEPIGDGRFQMHALLVAHAQSLLDH